MKTSSRPAPRLPANWKQGFTFPHSIPAHEEPFIEDGAWKVYVNEANGPEIVRIKYNFQTDTFEH